MVRGGCRDGVVTMNIALADPPDLPASSRDVFLPIIGGPPPEPEPEPETPETAFMALLMSDPRQQRPRLERCAALEAAALWKAQDIAQHDYWSHVAANGEMPNVTARRFGCKLPQDYGSGNNIESLVAGSPSATVMFNALAESPSHRPHLLGLNSFFRAQTHVGIAMVRGGQWGWVWAIYVAPCS